MIEGAGREVRPAHVTRSGAFRKWPGLSILRPAEMDNRMIFLTRFDGTEVVVNSDLIVTVEKIPDTVVTLTTGDRIMVKESVDEVVARAVAYRHRVLQGPGVRADAQDIAAGLEAAAGSAPVRLTREEP